MGRDIFDFSGIVHVKEGFNELPYTRAKKIYILTPLYPFPQKFMTHVCRKLHKALKPLNCVCV